MSTENNQNNYKAMWQDVGSDAGFGYIDIKFKPTYRIGLTNHVREEAIYKFLAPKSSDKVLDVGCASGRQIFKLANKINEGYGVDIAESFIKQADRYKEISKLNNTHFAVAVIEELPYQDNFFDKVICGEVLEHVFDKDLALSELRRILKPEGSLIITVPNLNADGTWWGRLLRLLGLRKFTPMTEFSQSELKKHGDSHVREFSGKTMTNWLSNQGFKVVKISSASFVDGPYMDILLKVPLHIGPLRQLIIWLEKALTKTGLLFGRHLVVEAQKI